MQDQRTWNMTPLTDQNFIIPENGRTNHLHASVHFPTLRFSPSFQHSEIHPTTSAHLLGRAPQQWRDLEVGGTGILGTETPSSQIYTDTICN